MLPVLMAAVSMIPDKACLSDWLKARIRRAPEEIVATHEFSMSTSNDAVAMFFAKRDTVDGSENEGRRDVQRPELHNGPIKA